MNLMHKLHYKLSALLIAFLTVINILTGSGFGPLYREEGSVDEYDYTRAERVYFDVQPLSCLVEDESVDIYRFFLALSNGAELVLTVKVLERSVMGASVKSIYPDVWMDEVSVEYGSWMMFVTGSELLCLDSFGCTDNPFIRMNNYPESMTFEARVKGQEYFVNRDRDWAVFWFVEKYVIDLLDGRRKQSRPDMRKERVKRGRSTNFNKRR